ncbi:MAG: hypothetical protein Q8R55_02730 [Candidatus Taylorbacteria bacterium]|nr:hypothetical protein [Candidatus Taylorbacteria bacterium]
MRGPICNALMLLTVGSLVYAQNGRVEILNRKEEVFVNVDCKKSKTCDLKKVEYFVEDYSVGIEGSYNYGTRFFARFETKKVKDLEKYVFVQFIKGCNYSSKLTDGEVEVMYDRVYPRDAGAITFKFPDWTVDSYDNDPVYSTYPGQSRFYLYRWNTVPGSFSTDTEKFYGWKKPKLPKVYIVDHPGQAFYSHDWAHNISLQFRTCIYKAEDVPKNAPYDNVNFAEPINCYEWNSSFVYNHFTHEFKTYSDIVPACQ